MSDPNELGGKSSRTTGIVVALVAAALLAFAAFSRSWLTHPQLGVGFGPIGCHHCGGPCEGTQLRIRDDLVPTTVCFPSDENLSNSEFVDRLRNRWDPVEGPNNSSTVFAPFGWITCGALTLTALALIATAIVAIRNRRPALPVSPASLSLLGVLLSLIAGCVFVATKPGGVGFIGMTVGKGGVANASYGFWAFGVGAVVAIVGAQMLAKVIRPIDPDLLADSMNPDQF